MKALAPRICAAMSATVFLTLSACSVETSSSEGGNSGKGKKNNDPKVVPLTLGEEVSAEGDVTKDDEGRFSLVRAYSFTLAEKTKLQVRKSVSNANCGSANARFSVIRGEKALGSVLIDRNKTYNGIPQETFDKALPAGEYLLHTLITLEQECVDMLFFYNFFVEKAQ